MMYRPFYNFIYCLHYCKEVLLKKIMLQFKWVRRYKEVFSEKVVPCMVADPDPHSIELSDTNQCVHISLRSLKQSLYF